jgi:hypothetical protein
VYLACISVVSQLHLSLSLSHRGSVGGVLGGKAFLHVPISDTVTVTPGVVHMVPDSTKPAINAFVLRSQCRF